MASFFSDPSLWRNLLTGLILLVAGFIAFVQRVNYTNRRNREKLIDALHAEIKAMNVVDDNSMEVLKKRIREGKKPFITADSTYTIFSSHQGELSLLDEKILSAVIKYYTLDRLLSETLLRFQDDQFIALDKKRKMRALDGFEKLNTTLLEYRRNALKLLCCSSSNR